jgi:hypothetical protein
LNVLSKFQSFGLGVKKQQAAQRPAQLLNIAEWIQ